MTTNTKTIIFNTLLFATGAAIGSLVTWKIVKTKYERIAQEEIDSVKETWATLSRMESGDLAPYDEEEDDEDEDDWDDEIVDAYHDLTRAYAQYTGSIAENDREGEGDDEVPYINGPYIIEPEEFGDGNYGHELRCLTYYADGVLADDWYVKYDVDETIGEDSVEYFGDKADGVLHIRNERLLADYEVVQDPRNYADLLAGNLLMPMYED